MQETKKRKEKKRNTLGKMHEPGRIHISLADQVTHVLRVNQGKLGQEEEENGHIYSLQHEISFLSVTILVFHLLSFPYFFCI
jgi:hypothetical protein